MKRTVLYGAFLVGCLSLAACQQHKESKTSEPDLTGKVAETSQITDCEIKVGDVTFTKSINGADTCVTILAGGGLEFNCPGIVMRNMMGVSPDFFNLVFLIKKSTLKVCRFIL